MNGVIMVYPHVQIEGGCQGGTIAPTQRVIEGCTCGLVQRVRGVLRGEGWRGDSGQRVPYFSGLSSLY